MTINQFLPWILPSMAISAVISYIRLYVSAILRTHKSHKNYVPPEKIVWKVFTIGDICAWIYLIIWMPVFIFLSVNIYAPIADEYLSNIYMTTDDLEIPLSVSAPIIVLFLLGPVIGSELVRIFVNKKFN